MTVRRRLFVLCAAVLVAAASPRAGNDLLRDLAGTWKAPEYRVRLSSDLDVAVWGEGASRVRAVELVIEPSGAAVLRVSQSVVDADGATQSHSASVVEARLTVGPPAMPSGSQDPLTRPAVTVTHAERRYLDDPDDRQPVERLEVSLSTIDPAGDRLNVRFDPELGRGSFGETLTRQ